MASLISPGVQVTVIDQSQYAPTQAGSVPLVILATAQDKLTPGDTLADGTTIANAEKIITVTSQRDLVNLFGNPFFAVDASDNPINGDERNEYGLLAAYSALGVTNTMYVQRANVDLAQLEGTGTRPTGTPPDGTYWLDVGTTNYGIYEWSHDTGFTLTTPSVITSTSYLSSGIPLASYGSIGEYAVVSTSSANPIYLKGYDNAWKLVGSDDWKSVVPTITGNVASPAVTIGAKMIINGNTVTMSGTTASTAATDINSASIRGVSARVNDNSLLEVFSNGLTILYSNAAGNARGTIDTAVSSADTLQITRGSVLLATDCAANLGILQSEFATISTANVFTYSAPTVVFAGYTAPPAFRTTDVTPRPNGSVWFKTTATGNGASYAIKEYSAVLDSFTQLSAPLYASDSAAIYGLDPVGGGASLDAGSLYVKFDTLDNDTATFTPFVKNVQGILTVTGTVAGGAALTYRANDSFSMSVSVPGSSTLSTATVTIGGSGNTQPATALVSAILAANLPNITAGINSDGQVFVSHLAGGTMQWTQLVGTPMSTAGLNSSARVQELISNLVYLASPWTELTYTYSATEPFSDPRDGTLWYYSDPLVADILINDGAGWKGYRNVSNDARGYDLTATDPAGPIFSASEPLTQNDGTSQLAQGDLWISTSDADLANYPVLYRYNGTSWDLFDNADDVDANGIVFADARWSATGNVDVVTGSLPTITSLITSDYVDPDCPAYQLYARGTILFNTRRSGFNVKRFESAGFTSAQLATVTGTEAATWVTQSGVDPTTGVPYFGTKAQRSTVVEALKAAVAASTVLREEQTNFNLICCPGYPELIQDMITLNNDRLNTAFIIGDSPLDLSSDSTTIDNWSRNTNLVVDNGVDGLVSNNEYLGVYYPSGFATNLDGESVVVPPSHMMLRAIIRSDAVSYPWFAPAGVRRGLIDNVTAIGYINREDNNTFVSIGVTGGLRDVLYRNRVNPITILPGVGLVAYGQKTRSAQASAMDRINVARLVVYLRTILGRVAQPFIFEPNDTITRSQVKGAFDAVFNDLVAKRAIYDYLVVCDTSNNTPIRIDNNELYIDIAIQPVKAIEFIYIPVRLQNTGAALTIN